MNVDDYRDVGSDIWRFPARLQDTDKDGVVDGDTLDVTADKGFNSRTDVRIRLFGVDTAEIYRPSDPEEYRRGIEQRDYVRAWTSLSDDECEWPFILITKKTTGKYGRYIGDLIDPVSDESLVDALITEFDL